MNHLQAEWGEIEPLMAFTPFPKKSDAFLNARQMHNNFVGGMAVDSRYLFTSSEDGRLRIWDKETLAPIATLDQGGMPINHLALSNDGQFLSGGDDNNNIVVYKRNEAGNFTALHTLRSHNNYVSKTAFAGDKLVSISKDATVKVWDYQAGKLLHTFSGHGDWVYALGTSPDGKYALTSSLNSSLKLWDLEKGKLAETILDGSSLHYVLGMTIGGDNDSGKGNHEAPNDILWIGDRVVSTAKDIVLWDAKNWEMLWRVNTSNTNKIKRIVHIPRYDMIITAGERIEGWNLTTGEQIFTAIGHEGKEMYSCIAWNEEILYTSDKDGVVKMWNIDTLVNHAEPLQHTNYVYCLHYNEASERLLTTSYDGSAIVYDLHAKPLKQIALFDTHGGKILGTVPEKTHKTMISAGGKIFVVDMLEKQIVDTFLLDNKLVQTDELIHLEGSKFLSIQLSYLPRLLDFEKEQITLMELPYTLTHWVRVGKHILCTSYPTKPLDRKDDKHTSKHKPKWKTPQNLVSQPPKNEHGEIKVSPFVMFNPQKPFEIEEFWLPEHITLTPKYDKVYPMFAYPFSEKIVAISYNSSDIVIWDIKAKKLLTILPTHEEYYHFLEVYAGKFITVGKSGELKIMNTATLQTETTEQLQGEVGSVHWHKEMNCLFYTRNKKTLVIFDLQTLKVRYQIDLDIEMFRLETYKNWLFIGTNQGRTFSFKLPHA